MNDQYYKGYEGETQICFSIGDNECTFKMWNGYFEMLMECMLNQNIANKGILEKYILHEGWYDESPWEIINIKDTIKQFQEINLKKLEDNQSELLLPLPEIINQLIVLFEEALIKDERIYILYD